MHDLQPKHSKSNKEDKFKLLAKLNISLSQLPKISASDPAIANSNFEIGDICRIERKDEDGKIKEYFRVVEK